MQSRAGGAAGAGTLFALRAIGIVIVARWLYSMSENGFMRTFGQMTLSPWACIHLLYIFLLLVLPGASAREERPFHPLPMWLRRALRWLAALGFLFAVVAIGHFAWSAGWARTVRVISDSNGWLLTAPALYLAVLWLCRPRAMLRTQMSAGQFALGRFSVKLDAPARAATVWNETRRLGQFMTSDLTLSIETSTGWRRHSGARARVALATREGLITLTQPARRIFGLTLWSADGLDTAYALQSRLSDGPVI